MMGMKEFMAAKAAAKASGTESTEELDEKALQSDAKELGMIAPTPQTTVDAIPEPVLPKGPKGSYRSVRLQRFFKANGTKIEPDADGFFIPADEEEAKELEHFAKQYDMVEYQTGEE